MKISVYAGSFVFTLFSTILNLVSLNKRTWLLYQAPPAVGLSLKTVWGLFEVCDYGPGGQKQCRDFPAPGFDCVATKVMKGPVHVTFTFCDNYRTAGYAAQLAAVFGCAALISHIIIVSRGRKFRDFGWKVLVGFICANAICQIVTLAYIMKSLHNSGIFPTGTHVSSAFVLSQISWSTDILLAASLVFAGIMAARRGDGYQSIPGTPRSRRYSHLEEEDDD